ncbi:glutaredoxin family protein [Paenibacillus sp. GCM10012307]|uniref:Glutaredoxin family protein n=1 Tax=Paenibacillus roseus TaxID=2798579 RepID=A0A934MMU2_9BACL|nr:glutaredoxin family protein [Paenibacillus roseus]MBJ6363730.1 glutaredoxin family protein [Paenibacillus roseus]
MSATKKVVLWSKTGCHYCAGVKDLLSNHNIAYENISVDGNDVLRDVLEVKYGVRHVPVVEVGSADGSSYVGWTNLNLEELETLLHA